MLEGCCVALGVVSGRADVDGLVEVVIVTLGGDANADPEDAVFVAGCEGGGNAVVHSGLPKVLKILKFKPNDTGSRLK